MQDRLPRIGDVRGRGLLLGIELVKDRAGKEPDNDLAEAVMYAALDAGLSFKTTMGNVLTLTPPLTITQDEMLRALDILEQAVAAAQIRAYRSSVACRSLPWGEGQGEGLAYQPLLPSGMCRSDCRQRA